MLKYNFRTGVKKIKTKTFILMSSLGLILGGGGLSLLAFTPAHAASPPTWDAKAPTAINFSCGGGSYPHTLNTVSEDSTNGNLTGSGSYNVDASYTWDMTGNTTSNSVTMHILYTGTALGSTYNLTGTIANDGSVSGSVDSNCESFTMPAGSFLPHCVATGFVRDGINMTARQIGGNVTGTLDATGCNIGVYYGPGTTGSVNGADIYGSNYYGVVAQQAAVDVTNSNIHNIGEVPPNGTQHGVGVYFANVAGVQNGDCIGNRTTSGTISGNTISAYQKGGIVATCTNTRVLIMKNTVTGYGVINYIAQNGIQVSLGATGDVGENTVSGNEYSGQNGASSGGILVFGGCGGAISAHVNVFENTLTNNDVSIFLVNYDSTCSVNTSTKTQENAHNNIISKTDNPTATTGTNITGWNATAGYQAGIEDVGNGDNVHNNTISGYPALGTVGTPSPIFQRAIDTTATPTLNAKVHNNTTT